MSHDVNKPAQLTVAEVERLIGIQPKPMTNPEPVPKPQPIEPSAWKVEENTSLLKNNIAIPDRPSNTAEKHWLVGTQTLALIGAYIIYGQRPGDKDFNNKRQRCIFFILKYVGAPDGIHSNDSLTRINLLFSFLEDNGRFPVQLERLIKDSVAWGPLDIHSIHWMLKSPCTITMNYAGDKFTMLS